MQKKLISMVTASLVVSSAIAGDRGVDIVTTGQAVLYYNTMATNATGTASQNLFGTAMNSDNTARDNTKANAGVQLNLDANLRNDFTFGSTINYLGTLGLEKNLVNGAMQNTNAGISENNIADDIYLSQLFIAKKIDNTTLKLGRQELPLSLSPFAFSENWNVFKNTFDTALIINSDIEDTTLVGAYVAQTNGNGFGHDMSSFNDLSVNNNPITGSDGIAINGPTYMVTVQNRSLPLTSMTLSYYDVAQVQAATNAGASIIWGDVMVANKSLPMGLRIGIQGGSIMPEASALKDTNAFGIKVGTSPIENLTLCVAYTTVNDGSVQIRNTGGVKTPLYTQLVMNQNAITLNNDTYLLKAAYNTGDFGTAIAQVSISTDNSVAKRDFTDMEFVYKIELGGVDLLAAYMHQTWSKTVATVDAQDIARVVARYNF